MAVSRIQDIILSKEYSWTYIICFFAQFFIIYPLFLVNTGRALKAHVDQQDDFRDEQLLKTIQGQLKLKATAMAREKLLQNAKPIIY